MTTDQVATIYLIPAQNLPRLKAEIDRLNKRAVKLEKPLIEFEVVSVKTIEKKDDLGFTYQQTVHECRVSGESPRLNGWSLVAALIPLPNSEMMVREVPGITCPEKYRHADLRCDHCGFLRKRNAVYVLRCDEDGPEQSVGEYRQVGRNCLGDFLGHANPEDLLANAEQIWKFMTACREAEEPDYYLGGGSRIPPQVEINRFVCLTSATIRKCGWTPRSQAESGQATADLVWRLCVGHGQEVRRLVKELGIVIEDQDVKLAEKALNWARALSPQERTTYLYNLGAACRQEIADYKTCGTVASVIAAFRRHQDQEASALAMKPKGHVGTIDKREVFEGLTIRAKKPFEGIWPKTLVKFTDKDGNVLVWWASGSPEIGEVGDVVKVKATVKEHGSYNGTPQTVLQRVVLES